MIDPNTSSRIAAEYEARIATIVAERDEWRTKAEVEAAAGNDMAERAVAVIAECDALAKELAEVKRELEIEMDRFDKAEQQIKFMLGTATVHFDPYMQTR